MIMTAQKKIKSHSDVIDYFQKLPFRAHTLKIRKLNA